MSSEFLRPPGMPYAYLSFEYPPHSWTSCRCGGAVAFAVEAWAGRYYETAQSRNKQMVTLE
jgi:hypothetical protein